MYETGQNKSTAEEYNKKELIRKALEQLKASYAPYSHFHVGAALLGVDGRIYTGCNVENSSYGATNCAERTAFFKAVSEGCREFKAIAIAGGESGNVTDYISPCGICRQVMGEFCEPKTFRVILAKSEDDYVEYLLEDLLPHAFSAADL